MNYGHKRNGALLAALGACMALAGDVAMATGGPFCQRIRGTGHTPVLQLPCEKDPSFFACIFGSTRGTLKSTWELYFNQPGTDISGFGLQVPPEALSALYQSDHEVFKTRRGRINGYAHYVFDDRMFDTGGFTATLFVTGGTGIYRNAAGWITQIGTDGTVERFIIIGEVCGPNIPRDINQHDD